MGGAGAAAPAGPRVPPPGEGRGAADPGQLAAAAEDGQTVSTCRTGQDTLCDVFVCLSPFTMQARH
jgi:hypothetical protein